MTTVAIATLGCKTNQFESAAMHEALTKAGYALVAITEPADIYVINTCTVTGKADAESRRLVRRAGRANPRATIVVTGCYAQVAADAMKDLPGVRMIIGNEEKRDLVELLRSIDDTLQIRISDIMAKDQAAPLSLESFSEHTRAFLQIQNGCEAFCSYCIVPYARGRSRSVPPHEALAGVNRLTHQGFQEIVLTGIHLGAYGLDLQPAGSLLALIQDIERLGVLPRLRIGSLEPQEIDQPFIEALASSTILCPHLHIPLQAGNDAVLQRMNRRYTTSQFQVLVEQLHRSIPGITLGFDLIAGFPGETDSEFQVGYDFIAQLPFATCHVFPFSARAGTPAATMPNQVPTAVIRERAALLRTLGEEKNRLWLQGCLGKTHQVLGQERIGTGEVKGLARNYLPVVYAGGAELLNREVAVRITAVGNGQARGEIVG
jgi:threonylcarbamoyladenosine tRNA methylthiotransferase MtaB